MVLACGSSVCYCYIISLFCLLSAYIMLCYMCTGSLSDPDQLPGLAHFCEHMLFLGTEKVKLLTLSCFLYPPSFLPSPLHFHSSILSSSPPPLYLSFISLPLCPITSMDLIGIWRCGWVEEFSFCWLDSQLPISYYVEWGKPPRSTLM